MCASMQRIESKDNSYLKQVRSLQSKKGRTAARCFLAEGLRLVEEAVSCADVASLLFDSRVLAEPRFAALAEAAAEKNVPLYETSSALFEKASCTEHPQGVLAVVRMQHAVLPVGQAWYAYTDAVSDPGNMGTILRSAHAAGCAGLLLSPDSADPYNPKVVRASMGAVFKLPFVQFFDKEEALCWMREQGVAPLVATAGGTDVRQCADVLRRPHVWVMGAEAQGVDAFWLAAAAQHVSLPMRADAESLNVASAAAVLFYQSCFAQGVL